MTKKLYLIIISVLMLLVAHDVESQALKKIQAEKIAFFTEKMSLSPEEATLFWPVYNEYQAKKHELNKQKNSVLLYFRTNEERLSEAEMKKLTERFISYQKEEAELIASYTEKFDDILPIEKVLKIYITEAEFKKYLIEQIRNKRVSPGLRDNR